jgi:hypothetical protein
MIKDEYFKIQKNNSNYKIYTKKGYHPIDNFFNIKYTDIPKHSKIEITCICDICSCETTSTFQNYYKITNGLIEKYFCKKCKYIKISQKFLSKSDEEKIEIREKTIKTNLDKYETITPLLNEKIKEKSSITIKKIYNVNNISQNLIIKNRKKNTSIKKYGVEHYFLLPNIIEKRKNTFISNNNKKIIEKYTSKIKNHFIILHYNNSLFTILDLRDNTEFRISLRILRDRLKWNKTEISTLLNPIGSKCTSGLEINLKNWLLSLNILFNENNRNIIFPKELDIYIPSLNLAIEFNGLYWHSEDFIDKNYHLDKSLKCQEKGIHLLHIFEDDWIFKQDIIKSIILNKLNINLCKIYARQCEIRVIEDSKLIREFLDKNHIQGYSQSSIKLGLYYNNELVSLMTFGYRHTNSKKEFELIRFCNKINLNVIGAASKLFNYFKKNYQFTDLISYSDFSLFDGKLYQTLGFTKQHLSKPNYFWVVDGIRYHRFNFNKQKLIKEGYDSSKTEVEIMHDRGYFRIFGCGQYRWKFNI